MTVIVMCEREYFGIIRGKLVSRQNKIRDVIYQILLVYNLPRIKENCNKAEMEGFW